MVVMPFNHVIILPVLCVLNIKTLCSTVPIAGFLLPQSPQLSDRLFLCTDSVTTFQKLLGPMKSQVLFLQSLNFFYIHDLCWVQALSLNPKFIPVSRFSTYKQCSEHTHPFIAT